MDKLTKEFNEYNKRQRRMHLPEKSFNAWMRIRKGKSTYKPRTIKSPFEATTAIRKSPKVPSGNGVGSVGRKKPENKYTGDKLMGIATMHKSNMVPVFRKEDAEDIARMRR